MNTGESLWAPQDLLDHLLNLRREIYQQGAALYETWRPHIQRHSFRYSALNLAFYLALRGHDLRPVQRALMPWGLSSLGRSEARAITNLDSTIASLSYICHREKQVGIRHKGRRAYFRGDWLLTKNTELVLGPRRTQRHVRIMVTMPADAAENYRFVYQLLHRGMDVARINCAHDAPPVWEAIIANVRRAEREVGRPCKILMDLGGPKPRLTKVLLNNDGGRLAVGSKIFLSRGSLDLDVNAAVICTCSIPEVLTNLTAGDPVMIDDGNVQGKVAEITPAGALITITHTGAKGAKIRPQKGLNFPRTVLNLSPLTHKDLDDLDFALQHADAIGFSFIKTPHDIALLQDEITRRAGTSGHNIAIVAKIETLPAIEHLPEIIVQAAAHNPLAVMIARGDLAVELGYKRLAELQEEILWICEAAHVPVIWATQVLENLVKEGTPSRAEITDAAMAVRAECVMLNKGPFLADAVTMLDDILSRMQSHQYKKTSQLRALRIGQNLLPPLSNP